MSGGERLVKPEEYRPMLSLGAGADAGTDFLTYTINWQPDQVVWAANDKVMLRRHYDEEVSWKDMKGEAFKRNYRPPSVPQHINISKWSDQDQNRAFGGKLDWAKSPFKSYFKDLRWAAGDKAGGGWRGVQGAACSLLPTASCVAFTDLPQPPAPPSRVLCDKPAAGDNGPSWAYPAVSANTLPGNTAVNQTSAGPTGKVPGDKPHAGKVQPHHQAPAKTSAATPEGHAPKKAVAHTN